MTYKITSHSILSRSTFWKGHIGMYMLFVRDGVGMSLLVEFNNYFIFIFFFYKNEVRNHLCVFSYLIFTIFIFWTNFVLISSYLNFIYVAYYTFLTFLVEYKNIQHWKENKVFLLVEELLWWVLSIYVIDIIKRKQLEYLALVVFS